MEGVRRTFTGLTASGVRENLARVRERIAAAGVHAPDRVGNLLCETGVGFFRPELNRVGIDDAYAARAELLVIVRIRRDDQVERIFHIVRGQLAAIVKQHAATQHELPGVGLAWMSA